MGLFSRKKKSDDDAVAPAAGSGGSGDDANNLKLTGGDAEDDNGGNGDDKKKGKKEKKDKAAEEAEKRDPRKARKFFDYAKTVADSRNYDYAIECYVNGLRHDPESLPHHELLYEVAKRRKVAGGKPAGFKDQYSHGGGKTPTERMLNAEFLWAKDPFNPTLALTVTEHAVKAEYFEVAYWMGSLTLEFAQAQKRPNKVQYLKLKDLFKEMESYPQAVKACALALQLAPQDMMLLKELHDLETEHTIHRSGVGQEGTTVNEVTKDVARQQALQQDDAIALNVDQQKEQIDRLRKGHLEKPDDVDLLGKFIRGLVASDNPVYEDEALRMMDEGHTKFGQYRFRVQAGDLRIKQQRRNLRELRAALAAADTDDQKKVIGEQMKQAAHDLLQFELAEYTERVKNYPTDMGMKFELGVRQFAVHRFDDAIASFQEAVNDPKRRAWALRYLGECFARKELFDAAVDTYHRGIEVHPYSDDRLALELKYELMKVLYNKAVTEKNLEAAQEGSKHCSQIAQIDYNYKDIREWTDRFRKLTDQLRGG